MVGAVATLTPMPMMLRVKEGDDASFAPPLEKHRSPVIHFLYRMVQDRAVSEELAQEVFLRVYRSRATYEPTAKSTTWLFRIATHLALNGCGTGARTAPGAPGRRRRTPVAGSGDAALRGASACERSAAGGSARRGGGAAGQAARGGVEHKYEEMEYTQIAGC